jgi:hypothetical protein
MSKPKRRTTLIMAAATACGLVAGLVAVFTAPSVFGNRSGSNRVERVAASSAKAPARKNFRFTVKKGKKKIPVTCLAVMEKPAQNKTTKLVQSRVGVGCSSVVQLSVQTFIEYRRPGQAAGEGGLLRAGPFRRTTKATAFFTPQVRCINGYTYGTSARIAAIPPFLNGPIQVGHEAKMTSCS